VNNSQSIERFSQYFIVIVGCELSADQRKAALLADGLIPPKTIFFSDNREINPEIAGYGVLLCSQVREVVQAIREIDQGRPFPISMLEREQPGMAPDRMQIESSSTPPAKDSACERGSGQGRVGSKASGACRVPKLPAARPGAGSQVRAGPKNKLRRTLRSASQDARDRVRPQPRSIYQAPPHCGGRPSGQPAQPGSCP
jgi:hypothetical protein